ncbi:MAG: hypothetical protein ACLSDQ_11490 [Adlercreutzia equolifaciens]
MTDEADVIRAADAVVLARRGSLRRCRRVHGGDGPDGGGARGGTGGAPFWASV